MNMPDLSYLQQQPFTVALVYEDGSAQGDIRLLPGVAEWRDPQLLIHPADGLDDFIVPPGAYQDIKLVTDELRPLLGEAAYYVVLHIAAVEDDDEHLTARYIELE